MQQQDLFSQSTARALDALATDAPPAVERPKSHLLTYQNWAGVHFAQPQFNDQGILAWEYLYDGDADDPIIRTHSAVFSGVPKDESGDPMRVVYPATIPNLWTFVHLPFINAGDKVRAVNMLLYWTALLPNTTMQSFVLRASTDLVPGTRYHRQPCTWSNEEEVHIREVTPQERMASMFGAPLPSQEARTTRTPVRKSKPFAAATKYNAHSPVRLYSQQQIGAWALGLVDRLALFFEPRTGKTKTAIVALKQGLEDQKITHVLIICPRCNMWDPWVPELETYGFEVRVLDSTQEEDENEIWEASADQLNYRAQHQQKPLAFVMNYERVKSRLPFMERYWDMTKVGVAADETSAIKNPTASRSKACHEVSKWAGMVTILNGTPFTQGPQDLWSQLRMLDPFGTITMNSYQEWASRWLEQVAPGKYRVRTEKETRLAFDMMLASISIRFSTGEADQFSGKERQFRYIQIRNTQQMRDQAKNILNGYVEVATKGVDKNSTFAGKKVQSVQDMVLVTYGLLRENACAYDKWKEVTGEYKRLRHDVDPKILWCLTKLESDPDEALVCYTQFNEEEWRLKEELTANGIEWAGLAPAPQVVRKHRVKGRLPIYVFERLETKFGFERIPRAACQFLVDPEDGLTYALLPDFLQEQEDLARWLGPQHSYSHQHMVQKSFTEQEQAEQIRRFNSGEARVFICKTQQARGFSLSRRKAVETMVGGRPAIVHLAPPWSLDTWDQANARCADNDENGVSVCTQVFALYTKGIEKKVLGALREKKSVQEELLKDAQRNGYQSFLENMVDEMTENDRDTGLFDAGEMNARRACGVAPTSKLTDTLVLNKMIEKWGKEYRWRNRADVLRWLQQEPRCPVEYNADTGAVLNMDHLIRESAFTLLAAAELTKKVADVQ